MEREAAINSSTHTRSVFYCPHDPNFTWDLNETIFPWILAAIASVASPAAVILNVLVIIAVRTRKELQKHSNILLSSMAIADILVGAINMPLSATVDVLISRQVLPDHVCMLDLVNVYFMFTITICSLYHLTVIAWERYVAIQKWIQYRVIVTRNRVKKLAILSWFAAVFTTLPGIVMAALDVDHKFLVTVVLGGLAIIIIAYFYIMVYLGVRKQNRSQISRTSALVRAKMERKVAMTTGLVTGALILSFVPVEVVGMLEEVFPALRTSLVFRSTETLMQLNSIVNPLLYCYRSRSFRNAVLEIVGIRKPQAAEQASGNVQYVRRKDPPGLVEDEFELQVVRSCPYVARSASCELAVLPDLSLLGFRGARLTRTMSAPSLALSINSSTGSPQQQQPSTILITTATIHAESPGVRDEARTNYKSHKDAKKRSERKSNRTDPSGLPEDAPKQHNMVKKLKPRSASCGPAVGIDDTVVRFHEVMLERPTSYPWLGKSSSRFCDNPQKQQSSFIVRTAATIHEKRPRDEARKTNPTSSKNVKSWERKRNRMDPSALPEHTLKQEKAAEKPRKRLIRSASCGTDVDSGADGLRFHEDMFKRPKFSPLLGKSGGLSCDDPQKQQSSSIVRTTATIRPERRERNKASETNPDSSTERKRSTKPALLIRKVSSSKFKDAITNDFQSIQEGTVTGRETSPSSANAAVNEEELSASGFTTKF